MNRGIALFVALATLLAHVLAIHNDGSGGLGVPYDQAYVPMRLARNLVFDGQMAWTPGMSAFESYASVLWVALLALGERLAASFPLSMNAYVQVIGITSMVLVVALASRFRRDRLASLVAPLLLSTSGAAAAAAANGLETALFTLLVFAAFLALERGSSRSLSLWLSLACLARPSGALFVVAMFVVRVAGRGEKDAGGALAPRVSLAAFALPAVVVAAITALRLWATGHAVPAAASPLLDPGQDQVREGLAYLRDFVVTTVAPLLLVFPAWHLVGGKLSRAGAHAVFLALAWFAAVAVQGRPTLPFFEAIVPALPFAFVGIQEGLIATLDGARTWARRVVIFALLACLFGSALGSKAPGDLGPLHIGAMHERWMRPSAPSRYGYDGTLGRMGLYEEITVTMRLRKLGHFFRDAIEPGARVLTPWPGACAYLSHQDVHDLLGRADPLYPTDRPRSWGRRERADVVGALSEEPDFCVPSCAAATYQWPLADLARSWMDGLDEERWTPGRFEKIEAELSNYELVTVPLRDAANRDAIEPAELFYLLRRRDRGDRPQLDLHVDQGQFRVQVRHESHPQVCDLRVEMRAADGRTFQLRPNGGIVEKRGVRARTSLLVFDNGSRPIDLVRGELPQAPSGTRWTEVRAQLVNPQFDDDDPYAFASEAVVSKL